MTLLLSRDALRARRDVARGGLHDLAASLRADLEPVLTGVREVPTEKALLSRAGGRCTCDGGYLAYDPLHVSHVCPRCRREWSGVVHDRFRLYWHQLWLAERTLHAAVLGALVDDASCLAASADLLERYATQYLRYPNVDNVLGPSRPFFSTYLESIWLLQLCVALDLLEETVDPSSLGALGSRVRDELIAPSVALIASYDEGMSNRQVWNNAAMLAAARLLDDAPLRERALFSPSGLHEHLERALLSDGSWYEGENYHLFAHRGLWYGVQLAEHGGHALPADLSARFAEGFAAPFRTVLPDLTYPARRDSQYAVSIRQPRFAESCELGLARGDDVRLTQVLARLYDPGTPRAETGRARSSADVERNGPPSGLSRADLNWRSLLFARETLPPLVPGELQSDLLPAQGFGVLRREGGAVYAALDYGTSGGGHGHPDRLNLLLSDGAQRWFDDPGTGSYVDDSLHWYRSTLAHNAPLIDGKSQPAVDGVLLAFEDQGSAGWINAHAALAPGLDVRRTLVAMSDYLIDVLTWEGDREHEITLPVHGVHVVDELDRPLAGAPAPPGGSTLREDGFSYLTEAATIAVAGSDAVRLLGRPADRASFKHLRGWTAAPRGARWTRALAPAAPGVGGRHPLVMVRTTAASGRVTSVWDWSDALLDVAIDADVMTVVRRDGRRDVHRNVDGMWHVAEHDAAGRRSVIQLHGLTPADARRMEKPATRKAAPRNIEVRVLPATITLGESHYRRSEPTWLEAGSPSAQVTMARVRGALQVEVMVTASARLFVPIDADNALDNEPAAINGSGVQLYATIGGASGGWLLVPRPDGDAVSVRPVEGWGTLRDVRARWQPTAAGYVLQAELALPPGVTEVQLDVLVNDAAPGRQRRRGQLVMSGAQGEFVYLRGDRHDAARLLRFELTDV